METSSKKYSPSHRYYPTTFNNYKRLTRLHELNSSEPARVPIHEGQEAASEDQPAIASDKTMPGCMYIQNLRAAVIGGKHLLPKFQTFLMQPFSIISPSRGMRDNCRLHQQILGSTPSPRTKLGFLVLFAGLRTCFLTNGYLVKVIYRASGRDLAHCENLLKGIKKRFS